MHVQAAECVSVLRQLRDRFRCTEQPYNECIKVRKSFHPLSFIIK